MSKIKKQQLDAKMVSVIENYDSTIQTLEDFVVIIRKTPGQFIGHIGNKGFINMIREIIQNSIDEIIRATKGESPATMVNVSYDERTNTVIVEDDGKGIPHQSMIRIFTNQHTSANFNKKEGDFVSGNHGQGGKVTNALSSQFIVESYILGKAKKIIFNDGYPDAEEPYDIPCEDKQGTRITFTPSIEIMGKITVTAHEILNNLLLLMLPLTPIGTVFYFNYITLDGKVHKEKLENIDGILTDLVNKTQNPLIKPIMASHDCGKMKMDIAFTYDMDSILDTEDISSFSNMCPTYLGGTHVEGFIAGITSFFKNYMNKIYLANNKSKLVITNNDIMSGLKAIVSVAHMQPIFTGQAKEYLSNDEMKPYVASEITFALQNWSKLNPKELLKVAGYLKGIAENRVKSESGKIKLSNNYKKSVVTGFPKGFIKAKGTKNLELIIFEGKSAAGGSINFRDNDRQALMPIRGKIPNAFNTPRHKFLENAEIAGIIDLLECGYGRDCDVKKCKYEKIIFAVDADSDGKGHIQVLLLVFFMIYLRPLIEAGMVYLACPPLYGLKVGKNKYEYFNNKFEFVKFIQRHFSKNNEICHLDGKKFTQQEITDLLYWNIDYVYEMEIAANRYALSPSLMEFMLRHINLDFNNFSKAIKKNYKFSEVEKRYDTIIIKALVDNEMQTGFLNQTLINESKDILHLMSKSPEELLFNGKKTSLYNIMKTFEDTIPSGITRYKGLGEMNPDQLAQSTILPDGDRTLIRYTLENAKEEMEMIRRLQTDKYQLIEHIEVSRRDLE